MKKSFGAFFVPVALGMVLASCASNQPAQKKDPTVTFSQESGVRFEKGTDYTLDFTVAPNTLDYDWYYSTDAAKLDQDKPTEVGSYYLNVDVIGNAEYNDYSAKLSFSIWEDTRTAPTITIKANGEATNNGETYETNNLPAFTYDAPSDAQVTYWYSKDDGETDLGQVAPTEPGVYAYNVKVAEDGKYLESTAFIWYTLVTPAADKTEVTDFRVSLQGKEYSASDWGASIQVASGSQINASVVSSVPEEAKDHVSIWYTALNDSSGTEIDILTAEPGEYVFCSGVKAEDELYKSSKHIYVPFSIVDDPASKITPEITIKYGDKTNTSNGKAGEWDVGQVPEFSYDVSVEDADVSYWYSKDDGETNLGQTAPTTPGTYAYNVQVNANSKYNKVHRFVWYIINAAGKTKVTGITLTFAGVTYTENKSNWDETEVPVGADEKELIQFTTNPAGAESHIKYWFEENGNDSNKRDTLPDVADGRSWILLYKVNPDSDTYVSALPAWGYMKAFKMVEAASSSEPQEKVTPEITIKYGEESNTSNGKAGEWKLGEVPTFSYECAPEDAEATWWFAKDEGETNLGQELPNEPGTYSYNVQVNASDKYNKVHRFVWFVVTAE